MKDENIALDVTGMSCTNCALTISKYLEKQGMGNVYVDFIQGKVKFSLAYNAKVQDIIKGINSLGYQVVNSADVLSNVSGDVVRWSGFAIPPPNLNTIEGRFYLCVIFTVPLLLHMFLNNGVLHNPIVQLILCIPVIIIGMKQFGKSAFNSIKSGIPNMDVLITLGSLSAFIYSLFGTIIYYNTDQLHNFLFYETAATIITIIMLGNMIESRSVKQTTTAIKDLTAIQPSKAKMIVGEFNKNEIIEVDINSIAPFDVLLVNNGDKIPVDGEIIFGDATIDESMITGESMPVEKKKGDKVIGGTILVNGSIKMLAKKVGKDTVLSQIIELVKNAQSSKPKIQRVGDKVSAIFVPAVVLIAIITFIISATIAKLSITASLLDSIAVLVISCPCAMGLATPTALMVGIGRAAKNGILIKGGETIENFATIKTIVFDKTGTLTTGKFKIDKIETFGIEENEIKGMLYHIEKHSSHPIAKSLVNECKAFANDFMGNTLIEFKEEKGLGISAKDNAGTTYLISSYQGAKDLTTDATHSLYICRNRDLIATIDLTDELKLNAKETITELKKKGIKTILLSGDSNYKCQQIANDLGMDAFYGEQSPSQKIEVISKLVKEAPTAMVGDGINDAPALTKATVGISMSNATQVAINSAQIIILNSSDLSFVIKALNLSKHTLLTIKQNLFWAFFYNIIAIPFAAIGMLSPMIAAMSMGFSDVIVVGNSLRLNLKKIFS
jgi:Cu+-exporting ATPase